MQRLKLIRSLCLLSALMVGVVPSIATAQESPMQERINEVLPTQDPYCTADGDGQYPNLPSTGAINTDAFADDSALCSAVTISGTSVPAGVVDWVLVELRVAVRSGGTPNSDDANIFTEIGSTGVTRSTVIARKPAFLLNNGRIVDAVAYADLGSHTSDTPDSCNLSEDVVANLEESNNCPDLIFDADNIADRLDTNSDGTDDDLYLVIRHRNHIDIMSSTPLTESSGVYTYDFISNVANAKDNEGAAGIKANAGPGNNRVAMFSGDSDYNNDIDIGDYNNAIALPNVDRGDAANLVYRRADNDYNGQVDISDYNESIRINRALSAVLPR